MEAWRHMRTADEKRGVVELFVRWLAPSQAPVDGIEACVRAQSTRQPHEVGVATPHVPVGSEAVR
jgi:hypothetical protein